MKPTRFLLALAAAAAASCGPASFPEPDARPTGLPDTDAVVYLIGDAGKATPDMPIIAQLKNEVAERARETEVVVAFLGDNVYEDGLPDSSHEDYAAEAAYLDAQIDILRGTRARGIFIPGNHDWGYGDERGLAQVKRQETYIAAAAGDGVDVAFLPAAGCPGPEVVQVASSVLLVMIETDLWLRKPEGSWSDGCRHASTDAALNSIQQALRENDAGASRQVAVLAHHPLKTRGPHGTYFGWKNQLFPFTNLWAPLYIPLPFLYPGVRNMGISRQDMNNSTNQRMRAELAAVFSEVAGQPLVYAAGHDHSLQVFDGEELGAGYVLVSGAGSKLTEVGKYDALFAAGKQHREYGYMRLEFFSDGRVLLSVITDGTASCDDRRNCRGEATVRYWKWLTSR
jgi:hypothetical protein